MGGDSLFQHFLDILNAIDRQSVLNFNAGISITPAVEKFFGTIANNPLIRGSLVFTCLVKAWDEADDSRRRGRMVAGLLATFVVTASSLWLQHLLTFHIRPFLDPTLHLRGTEEGRAMGWDRLGSFPSDTAMLYFSLSAVVFLEDRKAGIISFLWSLFAVGIIRVAQGWHYPSDIIGSFIIGPTCVYLASQFQYPTNFFERLLRLSESRLYIVYAVLFLLLADAYNLFPGLRGFVHALSILRTRLIG